MKEFFCPECGWSGLEDEVIFYDEFNICLCPNCDNILEYIGEE